MKPQSRPFSRCKIPGWQAVGFLPPVKEKWWILNLQGSKGDMGLPVASASQTDLSTRRQSAEAAQNSCWGQRWQGQKAGQIKRASLLTACRDKSPAAGGREGWEWDLGQMAHTFTDRRKNWGLEGWGDLSREFSFCLGKGRGLASSVSSLRATCTCCPRHHLVFSA